MVKDKSYEEVVHQLEEDAANPNKPAFQKHAFEPALVVSNHALKFALKSVYFDSRHVDRITTKHVRQYEAIGKTILLELLRFATNAITEFHLGGAWHLVRDDSQNMAAAYACLCFKEIVDACVQRKVIENPIDVDLFLQVFTHDTKWVRRDYIPILMCDRWKIPFWHYERVDCRTNGKAYTGQPVDNLKNVYTAVWMRLHAFLDSEKHALLNLIKSHTVYAQVTEGNPSDLFTARTYKLLVKLEIFEPCMYPFWYMVFEVEFVPSAFLTVKDEVIALTSDCLAMSRIEKSLMTPHDTIMRVIQQDRRYEALLSQNGFLQRFFAYYLKILETIQEIEEKRRQINLEEFLESNQDLDVSLSDEKWSNWVDSPEWWV